MGTRSALRRARSTYSEYLEKRIAPATFVVTNLNDSALFFQPAGPLEKVCTKLTLFPAYRSRQTHPTLTARYAAALFLTALSQVCWAADNTTALDALKALPKEEVKSLALIEAHDGTPGPERWHFLVYDPNSPSGVREYVVQGGELITARGISQFADRLTKENVIDDQALRIDSDKLARLAKSYAAANKIAITRMSYQLLKAQAAQAPLWRVHCLDAAGKSLGTLVVTATKGDVVSHQGFPNQPKSAPEEDDDQEPTPAKKTTQTKRSGVTESTSEPTPAADTPRKKTTTADSPPPPRRTERRTSAAPPSNSYRRTERRPPIAEYPPAQPPRQSNPLGNAFRKLFRIRD